MISERFFCYPLKSVFHRFQRQEIRSLIHVSGISALIKLEIYLENTAFHDQISQFYKDVSGIRIGENIDSLWLLNFQIFLILG